MSRPRATVARALALAALAACGDNARPDTAADAAADAAAADAATCPSFVDRQWGTAGQDRANVAFTADGAILLFGYEGGVTGLETIEPAGDATGYVTRLAADGGVAWRWDLTTARTDAVDAVTSLADGTLVVAGRSRVPRPGERDQFELVLAELDAGGAARWTHQAGLAPSERPMAIAARGDVRAVAGYHEIFIPQNAVLAWEDPFVYTWDAVAGVAAGRLVALGSSAEDVATGVDVSRDGSELLVAGNRDGGAPGGFVARVAPTQGELAVGLLMPGVLETTRALRVLPDGDVLATGSTWRRRGEAVIGEADVYVGRWDATLTTPRWITQLGSTASDTPLGLVVDEAGQSWIVGETLGDLAAPNAGANDVFVVALDAGGHERWRWQAGSAEDELVTGLAVGACETVLVAGGSRGALVAGAAPAGEDAFVLRAR